MNADMLDAILDKQRGRHANEAQSQRGATGCVVLLATATLVIGATLALAAARWLLTH